MNQQTIPEPAAVLHALGAGVCTITLNRPDAANAIAPEQRNRIIELLAEASASADVRVVVLRSNGRQFCAGADVSRIAGGRADAPARRAGDVTQTLLDGAQRLIAAVLDCRKPVIAVVQGAAAGLGAHLAYACDLVVASEEASFIESFVLRGLVIDAGGAYLLPRRVGMQKAKELAFFGDKLRAQEALALGLVCVRRPNFDHRRCCGLPDASTAA
ncbi:enoyl-CoA hydratase/isomerase family protein [Comamonadaceae bacterium G21597-S1]|nr:enoyl-CoA hydratase/isomerase family protein [Comamonadaceae bacterium G21597-S1]